MISCDVIWYHVSRMICYSWQATRNSLLRRGYPDGGFTPLLSCRWLDRTMRHSWSDEELQRWTALQYVPHQCTSGVQSASYYIIWHHMTSYWRTFCSYSALNSEILVLSTSWSSAGQWPKKRPNRGVVGARPELIQCTKSSQCGLAVFRYVSWYHSMSYDITCCVGTAFLDKASFLWPYYMLSAWSHASSRSRSV